MSVSSRRTGGPTIRFAGTSGLTGRQGAAHYGPEAYNALLDWAPLPAPRPERLEVWTDKLAGTPALDLLAELHDRFGLEWQRIAQLLGVSVPALNKWRNGGGLAPETDVSLRRLVAFSELLADGGIGDVAAWLASVPIADVPLTRGDVYRAGGSCDLLASVHEPQAGEALFDRWLPRWRELRPSRLFHPKVAFDDDGSVLVTLAEVPGTLGVGETIDSARQALLDDLRDYAERWDEASGTAEPALSDRVEAIRNAAGDDQLFRLVFGDP